MSDKDQSKKQPQTETLEAGGLPITIHTQYVRDVSFENPNAPDSLRAGKDVPEMDVNIGMDARPLEDDGLANLYEVGLTISAEAKRNGEPVFVAEVIYGVVVTIGEEVPEDQHHPILLIEIPRYAFPFARQILANVTSQGGYPPLLLNPVDFQAMYMQRFEKEIKEAQEASEKESKSSKK
ncbi:MAG: protein-export chaperone SecB [Alphaproteobacteria bacterium]|nr:protein-export chaperone SecB [Alphaproteobacteria bacterium]